MWIARDKDGSLWLFDVKPRREKYMWVEGSNSNHGAAEIDVLDSGSFPFPEVTWENSPKELIIKN